MVLSDLIRQLSQRAAAPAARQQNQARSPWGQQLQQRQAQLMQDMQQRQRQRAQAQQQYQNQMRSYRSNIVDYSQKRRAAGRAGRAAFGDENLFSGPAAEKYIESKVGKRPTMPTEPTTSTKNVIKQRYKRPKRTTSRTRSWRNTMPTGNRQFLRGVKIE